MSDELMKIADGGLLNFDDLGDDAFDANAVPLSQSGRVGEEVSSPTDNGWRAFRTLKIDSERLKWEYARTKKERESGIPENSEIRGSHFIVGIRGIPIQWQYGFSFSTGEGADMRTVCRTSKMVEHLPGGFVREVDSDLPLEFPASQVYQSQREPTALTQVLRRRQDNLILYGSRPPVGKPDGPGLRTCQECVAAEEYLENPGDYKKQVCRMQGALLFCVMQVATVEEDLINQKSTLKWMNIKDAKFITPRTPDGKAGVPLEGPFMIKLLGLTKVQHWSLGSGQYERQILDGPDTFLPKGVMSAGDYYNYIHDRDARGIRHTTHRATGMTVYPAVTEILTAGLVDTQYSKCMPVFYHQTSPEVIAGEQNWNAIDWVKIALKTYAAECKLAGVKSPAKVHKPGEYIEPAKSGRTPLPAPVEENGSSKPKIAPSDQGKDLNEEVASYAESSFAAFQVPGKD